MNTVKFLPNVLNNVFPGQIAFHRHQDLQIIQGHQNSNIVIASLGQCIIKVYVTLKKKVKEYGLPSPVPVYLQESPNIFSSAHIRSSIQLLVLKRHFESDRSLGIQRNL